MELRASAVPELGVSNQLRALRLKLIMDVSNLLAAYNDIVSEEYENFVGE